MVSVSPLLERPTIGLVYAWAGVAIMWAFWVSFVVFLAEPRQLLGWWPLPTINRGGAVKGPWFAAIIDLALIALFGLQHSLMARPWFKEHIAGRMLPAFERCTYVHMANLALFALVLLWQPIPVDIWNVGEGHIRQAVWAVFAGGWLVLFLGAWSFGIGELLGLDQMRAWRNGHPSPTPRLKTGRLYHWLRHPMYVGLLTAVWAAPRMSAGRLLLALGLTGYVLIAVRYEERDLLARFGAPYNRWRASPFSTRRPPRAS
jgi:protein-S-isoprenylcysteine O-methyltransferase Ste14